MDIFGYVEGKIADRGILLEEIATGEFDDHEMHRDFRRTLIIKLGDQAPSVFSGKFGLYYPLSLDEEEIVKKLEKLGITDFELNHQYLDSIPLRMAKGQINRLIKDEAIHFEKSPLYDKYLKASTKKYDLILLANCVGVE